MQAFLVIYLGPPTRKSILTFSLLYFILLWAKWNISTESSTLGQDVLTLVSSIHLVRNNVLQQSIWSAIKTPFNNNLLSSPAPYIEALLAIEIKDQMLLNFQVDIYLGSGKQTWGK